MAMRLNGINYHQFQHEISLSVAGLMYLYAVKLEVMVTMICLTL